MSICILLLHTMVLWPVMLVFKFYGVFCARRRLRGETDVHFANQRWKSHVTRRLRGGVGGRSIYGTKVGRCTQFDLPAITPAREVHNDFKRLV